MMLENQLSILSLFIELELKIAEVYNALADKFPGEGAFFKSHHAEELKHAQWIEYFRDKVERGEVRFHEDKTRTNTLKSFLDHAQNILNDAKSGKLTLLTALSLTSSIEESLIERKVFEHFDADSPELRESLKRLKEETGRHATEIKQLKLKYLNSSSR